MRTTASKTILSVLASMLCATATVAAEETETKEKIETTVAADIVNQYIWRGQDLGNASVQPSLSLSYKGLSLGAWGSVGLTDASDTKELDLTLAYSIAGLNIGITDYWFNTGADEKNRYFRYNTHSTNHVFEGNIGYDFKVLSLQAYTNFTGNDGVNKDGDRAFSTYVELQVPFTLATCSWEAALGVAPMATTSYATKEFSLTNVSVKATKEIKVTDSFSLPIFAQFATNPCDRKAYLVVGLTLQP